MTRDLIRHPVGRVQIVAEPLRKSGVVHEQSAGPRPAAIVRQRLHMFVGEILVVHGITHVRARRDVMQPNIPAVAIICVVAREYVQHWINCEIVYVTRALREHFKPGSIRAHAHHTAAAMRNGRAVFTYRFAIAVITHRDVDVAINAEQEHRLHIGDAIARCVAICSKRWRMHYE